MKKFYTEFKALAKHSEDDEDYLVFKLKGLESENYYVDSLPMFNSSLTDEIYNNKITVDIELGLYKHFKGNIYEVLGIALDVNDITKQYVYYKEAKPTNGTKPQHWIRPREMFFDMIKQVTCESRFKRIPEGENE